MIKRDSYQHGVILGLSSGMMLGLSLAVLIALRIGHWAPYFVGFICALWVNVVVQFALRRLPEDTGGTASN
jgi:hypothetical protein